MLVIDPTPHTIDDITADEFRRLLDANLLSYFLMSKVTVGNIIKFMYKCVQMSYQRSKLFSIKCAIPLDIAINIIYSKCEVTE